MPAVTDDAAAGASVVAVVPSLALLADACARKAIATGDFTDLDHLAERILAFQDRYNATAIPFDRRYTRGDLNDYLARLRRHDDSDQLASRQAS